jgi:hypothetical protein
MPLSVVVRSIVTSSRNGTSGLRQCVGIAGANTQREQFLRGSPQGAWQFQHDVYVLFFAWPMHEIDRFAAYSYTERLRNGLGADAVQCGFFFVDNENCFRLIGLDIPINIDNAWRPPENLAHLFCERESRLFARVIDFSN